MRIERYYSSVKEDKSKLADDATLLLQRQDYVGFFKACGPNYVRGIRRAQEVTAMFKFTSTSEERASEFTEKLKSSKFDNDTASSDVSRQSKYAAMNSSLSITIVGYGLGLTEDGSETLIATTLKEFNQVMRFAFNTMTKSKNSHHIGMVYGIEVAPWVENVQFQLSSGLQDEDIEIPIPRSLIARAYRRTNPSDKDFVRSERDAFRCKDPAYEMDKHGYCCEAGSLYNHADSEYDESDPQLRVCRPLRTLDKAVVRENMASNGEFVARLDRALRYKANQLNTLEKCISAARSIPERFDYYYLKPQSTVKYDKEIEFVFSAFELKMALDPFNDYSMVKHMGKELDEFIDMYYQPCLAALFGANIGTSSETEASYFSAYAWHTHDACIKLSCLGSNVRWDRKNGGCIPSLISGVSAIGYEDGEDEYCKYDIDNDFDDEQECKYKTSDLSDFHGKVTTCWNQTLPSGRIDYFMEHFCMPRISGNKLSTDDEQTLKDNYAGGCLPSPTPVTDSRRRLLSEDYDASTLNLKRKS